MTGRDGPRLCYVNHKKRHDKDWELLPVVKPFMPRPARMSPEKKKPFHQVKSGPRAPKVHYLRGKKRKRVMAAQGNVYCKRKKGNTARGRELPSQGAVRPDGTEGGETETVVHLRSTTNSGQRGRHLGGMGISRIQWHVGLFFYTK